MRGPDHRTRGRAWPGATAGVVVGVALTGLLAVTGTGRHDTAGPTTTPVLTDAAPIAAATASPPDAVEALLDAWERSRTGTYRVVLRFTRTVPGVEGGLGADRLLVQRPPDRLTSQFGAVSGRLDGYEIGCAPDPAGAVQCRRGSPVAPYADEVADEVATLRRLVEGPNAPYRVTLDPADPRCLTLALRAPVPAPPYGEAARWCFDPTTGAQVDIESRTNGGEVVDREQVVGLDPSVSDADLAALVPDLTAERPSEASPTTP